MDVNNRRSFLKTGASLPLLAQAGGALAFLGVSQHSAQASLDAQAAGKGLLGSSSAGVRPGEGAPGLSLTQAFQPVSMRIADTVDVAEGFDSYVLAKLGDPINAAGDLFGDCCDYTAFLKGETDDQAFLWVNHEYVQVAIRYGKWIPGAEKTKAQVDEERKLVGGSYLELKKVDGRYSVKSDSRIAFRLDGTTPIPMVGPAGGDTAIGTMGNCSGGVTPWGTLLTAEENVHDYYDKTTESYYGWAHHYPMNPEHYGYIVEIDPKSKSARKLTGLGRFAHEGATIHKARNGHIVAYMGDDARFQCLFKFVSSKKASGDARKDRDLLVDGTLYVADLSSGRWEKLTPDHPRLMADKQGRFKTQRDISIHTREAALLVGGTPLNRPEGIAVDPQSGIVLVALTNNSKAGDYHGSILAVTEENGDHSGVKFQAETVLTGGPRAGISCPDNICTGPGAFLWAGMDISSTSMGNGAYKAFPRNALHRIEADSNGNLYARRFLLCPPGAEVTGPSFSDDEKSLFVSIQHPGEGSFMKSSELTSRWPLGRGNPLSSVIVVQAQNGSFS